MKFSKALNNNVIIATDQSDMDHILIGRGIGYQKEIGDNINLKNVEKIFYSKDTNTQSLFNIVNEMPIEHFQIATEIIDYAQFMLKTELNQSVYVSLTDHINYLLIRIQENLILKSPLVWDIQRFYPKEYKIGRAAVELIEETFDVKVPEGEVAAIALHIINANEQQESQESLEYIKLMDDIMRIISHSINLPKDKNNVNYKRLLTHIKFFVERVMRGDQSDSNYSLFENITLNYSEAFNVTKMIDDYIKKTKKYNLSTDEMTFLTIHLHRVIERK